MLVYCALGSGFKLCIRVWVGGATKQEKRGVSEGGQEGPRESERKQSIFIISQNLLVKKTRVLSFLDCSLLISPPSHKSTHSHGFHYTRPRG